ncbi:MAG: archaeal proteasome endopeptidase complex subunit beta [Candidatus Asgardarchaeia archaeon]
MIDRYGVDENKILKSGTTTVGIVTKEAVILATESQATMGTLVANKKVPKIYNITDRVAITISGSVADCQQLVETIRANIKLYELESGHKARVKSVAKFTSNILFQQRYFPYLSQLLIGGYDELGPHLFSLDPLGSLIEEDGFTATGSGSVIAFGVLESEYKKDMSVKEAIEMAKRAIDSARKRDTASGGDMQIAIIRKNGIEKKIISS